MRDRIGKIFKSKDGVTFVFALVVFMIAAIISATIVSVAMNNLKYASAHAKERDFNF